jgi:hypothetical protein
MSKKTSHTSKTTRTRNKEQKQLDIPSFPGGVFSQMVFLQFMQTRDHALKGYTYIPKTSTARYLQSAHDKARVNMHDKGMNHWCKSKEESNTTTLPKYI